MLDLEKETLHRLTQPWKDRDNQTVHAGDIYEALIASPATCAETVLEIVEFIANLESRMVNLDLTNPSCHVTAAKHQGAILAATTIFQSFAQIAVTSQENPQDDNQ